ncbi:MAG: ATP-binding cassette domain-containing protein [Candidatus Accumulibacter meliphilus]|jgi:predicted ATPase|uniref:ATP-binding cassette domain-containing protein n=1 Tax=Candidatus Accumulibacter meliphilus TaxID=2211374 RepID=A0A369XK67_9PROT|nr:MAG: ATP-binding cassette domain-containing protein [Candidatus Accumulibacter meliphilus]
MIERISVSNFKSLAKFTLRCSKFNCLVGMNGAGKSTVLQAIDFIAQLMEGHLSEWLEMREWTAQELNCKLRAESNVGLVVQYRLSDGRQLTWVAAFNRHELQCSQEVLVVPGGGEQLRVKGKSYRLEAGPEIPIVFNYQGSVLSQLRNDGLPLVVQEFRDSMRRVRSLELLSPNLMRRRARTTDSDIGPGGEKLTAFLHGIKGEQRNALIALLKTFYPQLIDFRVSSQRAGWKKLNVIEQFGSQRLETEARHINDGLLRVLAILAQTDSDRSLILLDEIENGMNPEIIEKLVDVLVEASQQILVTSHSPMILNYLDDEVARRAVNFIYKNPKGETLARPFFSIPRIGEKLKVMGPGEAFVDTDLNLLTQECVALDDKELAEEAARAAENR